MSRLIDADVLERDMQYEWERNEISNGDWISFREILNSQPTISPKGIIPTEWDEAFRIASEIRMAVGCKTAKECWELARSGGIQRAKTGRWIVYSDKGISGHECSECAFHKLKIDDYSYCPNCGAQMEEVTE